MATLTLDKPKSSRSPNKRNAGPGADAINAAYAEFCGSATMMALVIGQLLREQCNVVCGQGRNNQHTEENDRFGTWLEANCTIPRRTAYRWMEMAERVCDALHSEQVIEIDNVEVSLSEVLSARSPQSLPEEAQAWRQTFFDFVADKTMKECLALVIVEGKDAHSVTRAHNGRTTGGTKGENRKAFAKFAGVKLRHLTTFFNSSMPQAEMGKIALALEASIELWPEWVLKAVAAKAAKELKLSESERAARGKSLRTATNKTP